jgi:hypothetical protein
VTSGVVPKFLPAVLCEPVCILPKRIGRGSSLSDNAEAGESGRADLFADLASKHLSGIDWHPALAEGAVVRFLLLADAVFDGTEKGGERDCFGRRALSRINTGLISRRPYLM